MPYERYCPLSLLNGVMTFRWDKRCSAQSCTSCTFSSLEPSKRLQGGQQNANHRECFDRLEGLSIHPTLTRSSAVAGGALSCETFVGIVNI